MIQHTPEMRLVKIGFHHTQSDKNFYLTASTEVGKESAIAATEVSAFEENKFGLCCTEIINLASVCLHVCINSLMINLRLHK